MRSRAFVSQLTFSYFPPQVLTTEISNSIIYLILDQDSESWQICMEKNLAMRIVTVLVNEKAKVGVEFSYLKTP